MKRIFIVFIVCFLPSIVGAAPLLYTVTGTATVDDRVTGILYPNLNVTGEIYFNDAVTVEYSTVPGKPTHFLNEIVFFSLTIGQYSFWGTGTFDSHYYWGTDPLYGFTCTHDASVMNGSGDWTDWSFMDGGTSFYDENGNAYDTGLDYSDFLNVPYRIFSSDLPVFITDGPNIYLHEFEIIRGISSVLVPEPSRGGNGERLRDRIPRSLVND